MPNELFPIDLADLVRSEWGKSPDQIEHNPPLPPSEVLYAVLSRAYIATQTFEEGTPVRFQLTVVQDWEQGHDGNRDPHVAPYFALDGRRPFSASELRKLGGCADAEQSLIEVVYGGEDPDSLQISGFWTVGRRFFEAQKGMSYQLYPFPRALNVRGVAPGTLQVYECSRILGTLRSGGIERAVHPQNRLVLGGARTLFEQGAQLFNLERLDRPDAQRSPDAGFALLAFTNVVFSILNRIQENRHGGTVVIFDPSDREAIESNLKVKYRLVEEPPPLGNKLRVFLQNRDKLVAPINPVELDPTRSRRLLQRETDASVASLSEASQAVAEFCNADGAVIVSTGLSVLGFGAEVTAPSRHESVFEVSLDGGSRETALDVQSAGMRFRSAVNLVSACPSSLAFVVSQDGDITLVCSDGGNVHVTKKYPTNSVNSIR